jgi:hypothetical protein
VSVLNLQFGVVECLRFIYDIQSINSKSG